MIRASSIYYAILICVVVGICCSALLLISQYSNLFALQMEMRTELLANNRSAINYFLAKGPTSIGDSDDIDLFDNGIVSRATTHPWGLYHVLQVRSTLKQDTVSRSVLIGQKYKKRPALYLADSEKPLQMVGKAKIIGDAYVPQKGIKKGYITSQSFSSFTFLEGAQWHATHKLPKPKAGFVVPARLTDTVAFVEELKKGEKVYNAFGNAPLYLNLRENELLGRELEGKVVLKARDSIFIHRDNRLEDIVIHAPIVVFQKGFVGSVQVTASQKIILQEGAVLEYPSSLYLNFEESEESLIYLESGSKVLGKVALVGTVGGKPGINRITIGKDAEVIGEVYCEGSTALKGQVIGSLFTHDFYLKTEASSYENYIEDGRVDQKALDPGFLGTMIDDNIIGSYGIIKKL
ncbi:hypothetical protein LDL77_19175 [Flagellimonas marinaquae]|uniref:hypothetical protein n=1 Tax=Flagellimonas aurea TaxID=2915619 RepID=UPI001CE14644|nr:hypothetical protein LDL77_19175 [Allomuricauda aquimarina]